jgi:hypothetical protein
VEPRAQQRTQGLVCTPWATLRLWVDRLVPGSLRPFGGCVTGTPVPSPPPVNKAVCESFMGLCLKIDEVRHPGQIAVPAEGSPQTPQADMWQGSHGLGTCHTSGSTVRKSGL